VQLVVHGPFRQRVVVSVPAPLHSVQQRLEHVRQDDEQAAEGEGERHSQHRERGEAGAQDFLFRRVLAVFCDRRMGKGTWGGKVGRRAYLSRHDAKITSPVIDALKLQQTRPYVMR
jgi:hypothetical protein